MIEINADDDEPQGPPTPGDLQKAYIDMIEGLKANALPSETLREISANFAKAAGLDRIKEFPGLNIPPERLLAVPEAHEELMRAQFDQFEIDTSPQDTARNTERMAESLEAQHETVAQLVHLTASSLALTTEQREASERSERFSRRTTITSVVIGAASLAASVAAIVVAVVVR